VRGRTGARLRFATWNVRHCLGLDRRIAPARVVDVLGALDADVLAVQELDAGQPRSGRMDQPALLADALGMSLVFCPTVKLNEGTYGHALLTRLPSIDTSVVPLPGIAGTEPRALIETTLSLGARTLRVIATHLSLSAAERALQVRAITARLAPWSDSAALLADLNAGPGQIGYRELTAGPLRDPFQRTPTRARCTWPSPWPFRALDHVLLSPSFHLRHAYVSAAGAARFASDHRPVVADVQITVGGHDDCSIP
jgi:endonuclease/exonuclease/phosphatase family metal-dependent hydrolase